MKIAPYLCIIALIISNSLSTAPECVTQSAHLSERYDYKQLRSANCNCPCQHSYKISRLRNKCPQCGHEAVERPLTRRTYNAPAPIINIDAFKSRIAERINQQG